MPASPASRVHYEDRQFIRLAELRDEQAYHLLQRRRHNLSHHSWGIVAGLDMLEEDGRPVVRPGLAIDGYGRELLLLNRVACGREQFDRLDTRRIDLWLEYRLDIREERTGNACRAGQADAPHRAVERAEVVMMRGGADPDPRHPPGVPVTAFEEPMLATSDDPAQRWPVYLGRVVMNLSEKGEIDFEIDTANRVYVGLNAELIDHPGNASRVELGRRPAQPDTRQVGADVYQYAAGATRDFAVFSADGTAGTLEPTLAVYPEATQLRGTTEVHGNLVLEGSSLQFPDNASAAAATGGNPAIYRAGDALRIDLGVLDGTSRALSIGVTEDSVFKPALEVRFEAAGGGGVQPTVTVFGNLHLKGSLESTDVRTRTITGDVAALLTGMIQSTIAGGGG
jgi:hypothetical protein